MSKEQKPVNVLTIFIAVFFGGLALVILLASIVAIAWWWHTASR